MRPPFSFRSCRKENGPCTVQKKRTLRRVGLRRRRPPAAGGGWLAVPCSSQGRKRPALGETSSPGKYRDTLSLPPRCRSRSREEQPAAAKREAARCDNHPDEAGTIRHGTVVSSSQKMIACPKAGPNRSRHRYADPRAHGGPPHRSAPKRPFLLDRALRSRWRLCRLRMRRTPCGCGPFVSGLSAAAHAAVGLRHAPAGAVFLSRTKREWGVHPRWTSPPGGSQPPVAAVQRPASLPGRAPKTGAPPLYFSSNTDTYTVPVTSNPSLAFT